MAKLKVVDRDGQSHEISAQPGSNLMEILRNAGLEIEAICGGQCICSTCHVYISERWAARRTNGDQSEGIQHRVRHVLEARRGVGLFFWKRSNRNSATLLGRALIFGDCS